MITVALVDDHELIRTGLRRAIDQAHGFEVVGEAAGVGAGREVIVHTRPSVAVIDVRLKDGNGLDLVARLRKDLPKLGIVVLTMYAGDETLLSAMRAGASAMVSKDEPVDRVLAALSHAHETPGTFVAADLAGALARASANPRPEFSARERELMQLLAAGKSVGQIARSMHVGESSVKGQASRLYAKLGAANRAQAVLLAVKAGLLSPKMRENRPFGPRAD